MKINVEEAKNCFKLLDFYRHKYTLSIEEIKALGEFELWIFQNRRRGGEENERQLF